MAFEECIDSKRPFTCKGRVASYELVLNTNDVQSRKVDLDCVKVREKITHKIADALFFIAELNGLDEIVREKVIAVETKGTAYKDAILQLVTTFDRVLSPLKIDAHARIVGRSIPKIRPTNEYRKLELKYKTIKDRSDKLTETYTSFDKFTIK